MNEEYVIHEDKDYKEGDGTKVYISNGVIVFDAVSEGGYCGYDWTCDVEYLKQHLETYEKWKEIRNENIKEM